MTDNGIFSDYESDRYKTILYAVMCNDLSEIIKGENYSKEQFKQRSFSKCQTGKKSMHIAKWWMS